jgi:hypothetical protein
VSVEKTTYGPREWPEGHVSTWPPEIRKAYLRDAIKQERDRQHKERMAEARRAYHEKVAEKRRLEEGAAEVRDEIATAVRL